MRVRSQRASRVAASAIQNAHSRPERQAAMRVRSASLMPARSTLYFCMPPTLSTLGHR